MKIDSSRALFANQLRGLAVIAVIIIHWCGIYWYARDVVASYIFAPVVEGPPSGMMNFLNIRTVNYGPLGVSIFYLISGFVIPFSLARTRPLSFMIARAMRIYPTYIAASCIMLSIVYLSSRYWGHTFTMPWQTLLANLTLTQTSLGKPSIDLVNGTLATEIKFYIICAVLYKQIRNGNSLCIIAFAAATLAFCELYPSAFGNFTITSLSMDSFKTEFMCIIFMFIGTGFYHHYTGTYTTPKLGLYIAILLIIFMLCWPHTSWANQIPNIPQNYFYGLVVFTVSYALRKYFRPIAPLDFIANISYPIYVLHSIIGYSSIRFLMDRGLSFPISGLLSLIFVITLAYGLHRLVEVPTMHWGKRLSKRNTVPHTPAQAIDVQQPT
jgi:peptidoglycan/LPS O-acetylase OafA/YrhL